MGLTRVRVVINRGYLKIRTTANRNSTYKTLSIPIKKEYWNKEDQEIRRSHPEHEKLNDYIKEELRKHILYGELPTKTIQGEPDIVAYFQRHINNTSNTGTKEVRKATLKKLVKYLQKSGIKELRFSDLSAEHVYNFYSHLKSEVSLNTAAHHIRMFKVVVNKAIAEGRVNYPINPFITVKKMKRIEPEIYGLSLLEISQLMQENHFRPNKHLSAFLFCLFAQGMRKRDMLMLRWDNFDFHYDQLICTHVVKKTNKPNKIVLSEMAVVFLLLQIQDYHPGLKDTIQNLSVKEREQREELEKNEAILLQYTSLKESEKKMFIEKRIAESKNPEAAELELYNTVEELKVEIQKNELVIQEYGMDIYLTISKAVHNLSLRSPKDFVFDYLKGESISKYESDREWKLVDNKSKLFNYHLKKVGLNVGFKKLNPHLARHSYARMLDENNTSIQTIQKLMSHSDPQRTAGYIRRLNKEAENDANLQLAEKFKKVRYQSTP